MTVTQRDTYAVVSIANGDSFGELPGMLQFLQVAAAVSIANGDSFGELRGRITVLWDTVSCFNREWRFFRGYHSLPTVDVIFDRSIANGDSFGSYSGTLSPSSLILLFQSRMAILLGSYRRNCCIVVKRCRFQSRMAILLGSYLPLSFCNYQISDSFNREWRFFWGAVIAASCW
ncbi:MAG: hypothetical protein H6656_19085 [Ardenticatenaceae bacterium]|nr:hypothetical protein [Ardenticatenaceae bacterium]